MRYQLTLLPGDGIGPEIIECTLKVIDAAGVNIQWERYNIGETALKESGNSIPDEVIEAIKRNKVALKGPATTPIGTGFRSVNVELRKRLSLYAGLRPIRTFVGAPTLYKEIDIVFVRENTECLYAGVEHLVGVDAAESIRIITRPACERIVKYAFEYAISAGRKKVTAVHKANILKATCGLFLSVAQGVAKLYPQIEFNDRIVDNMAMQLVKKPQEYDVIVTTNLFGDILSDLGAGLIGGLGLAPSANIGDESAVFEPVHGSAPKYAGANKVNPCAAILAGVMMLNHLGENLASKKIVNAIERVIESGKTVTYDLGGQASTTEMTEAIIKEL